MNTKTFIGFLVLILCMLFMFGYIVKVINEYHTDVSDVEPSKPNIIESEGWM